MINDILSISRYFNKLAQKLDIKIYFDPLEQKILDLLLSVVKEKTPNTTLRIAGGYIRDKLLGKKSHDIDIAINNMSGLKFATLVKEYMDERGMQNDYGNLSVVKANPEQSKHLETAIFTLYGIPIDFVNLRKETYADTRIPTVEPGTAEEDASRRDLTINAIFYNINEGKIEDFVGGVEDLKNGIARAPIDPIQMFMDDPLRILRAIRFASKYNLVLDPEMIKASKNPEVQKKFKEKVSIDRIRTELFGQEEPEGFKPGAFIGPNPRRAVELLKEMGLKDLIFGISKEEEEKLKLEKGIIPIESEQHNPHHDLTIWEHTLKTLEHLVKYETTPEQKEKYEDYLVRNLSAILHDVGKCDLCAIQTYKPGTPEYEEKVKKLLEKYNLKHEGELRTYSGHDVSSAKIAEHILNRLGAPNKVKERVIRLVRNHMRPHAMVDEEFSDKALRKFIEELEGDWRHSLDLAIADAHGKTNVEGGLRDKYVNIINRIDKLISQMGGTKVKMPLNGNDLINIFGFKQGKLLGQALKELKEKVLENPNMTKEEAIEFIKSLNLQEKKANLKLAVPLDTEPLHSLHDPEMRSVLSNKQVLVFHGTSSKKLLEIMLHGSLDPAISQENKIWETSSFGIFVTSRSSGFTGAEMYARKASSNDNSDPVILELLIPLNWIDTDPDDTRYDEVGKPNDLGRSQGVVTKVISIKRIKRIKLQGPEIGRVAPSGQSGMFDSGSTEWLPIGTMLAKIKKAINKGIELPIEYIRMVEINKPGLSKSPPTSDLEEKIAQILTYIHDNVWDPAERYGDRSVYDIALIFASTHKNIINMNAGRVLEEFCKIIHKPYEDILHYNGEPKAAENLFSFYKRTF